MFLSFLTGNLTNFKSGSDPNPRNHRNVRNLRNPVRIGRWTFDA
jgi:hypothetical protein